MPKAENKTTLSKFLKQAAAPDTLTVIFQLTDKCVLSCRYCFAKGSYSQDNKKTSINTDIIDKAIEQSFKTRHKEITFEWTGGEPFLAGINFYKHIVKVQKKYTDKKFGNYIQTSGYLYNEELIDYLVDNHIKISITIDGTSDVHDFNRPAGRDKPSLERILRTRDYIIKKQGYCGFISTVTKKNISEEAKILEFFRSLNADSFHSNPYIYFSKNRVKDKSIALSNEDYASYFINQFNAWFIQGKKLPVPRTIDYILQNVNSKTEIRNALCTFGGKCIMNFITITPYGDTYTCPKFVGIKSMKLGNIKYSAIADILSQKNPVMYRIINERIYAVNICEKENCRYLHLCNGGCPYYSLINSNGKNIKEKDWLCRGKKMIYQYLESSINIIKKDLKK